MKQKLQKPGLAGLAALAATAFFGTARADISAYVSAAYSANGSWNNDPNGNAPFYSSGNLSNASLFSNHSAPTPPAGAAAAALGETFTMTNGAGGIGITSPLNGASNYALTGVSMLISGGGTSSSVLTLHLFDVTTNLNGSVIASGTSYNFSQNGDLLGEGNGLTWTNSKNSGAEQQVYIGLQICPNTYGDRVILQTNHVYTLEVWVPTAEVGSAFNWYKSSAAPQDPGGNFMASVNASLSMARESGAAEGFTGSSQHTWAMALYGYPTNAAGSVNANTNAVPMTNIWIDQFNSLAQETVGGITNTYVGTNDYAANGITNIWGNWFGSAWVSNSWDSTSDAQNNTNSGSLRIYANFPAGSQFVVFDNYTGISPALNGPALGITNFQCDVRFDPSSATKTNAGVDGGNPFFGHLQFGMAAPSTPGGSGLTSQHYYPTGYDIVATNTNWVHVNIPLNVNSDPYLVSISDVLIHIDGTFYSPNLNGPSILWVDNIKFQAPNSFVVPPPPKPTMAVQKTTPELRVFAGSSANTYDREELASVDTSQSWIGGTYPVSYSFTIKDDNAHFGAFQTHIFLVPINTLPSGNSPTANEYVEYQASNNLWLQINGTTSNTVTANVSWKTNLPNANPNIVALNITNSNIIGTWTLTFTSPTNGTLTAPGTNAAAFTITDPAAATDFGNPVEAYFGVQANSTGGEGAYEDYTQITVTNVAGVNESDNFTMDSAINTGLWSFNPTAASSYILLVTTNTPLWITWSAPAIGFGLGVSPVLPATSGFVLPSSYNGYYDQPTTVNEGGSMFWSLIPSDCLPSYANPGQSNAFFEFSNPPPAN